MQQFPFTLRYYNSNCRPGVIWVEAENFLEALQRLRENYDLRYARISAGETKEYHLNESLPIDK